MVEGILKRCVGTPLSYHLEMRDSLFAKLVVHLGKIRNAIAEKALNDEGIPFSILRWHLFRRQATRDAALTSRISRELNLPSLNIYKGLSGQSAGSRSLFILAGGASVNKLSNSQWAEISRGTSIGINFWPIHRFCPDFLTTEIDKNAKCRSDATRFLERQILINYKKRPPGILVLRPNWPPRRAMLYELPEEFKTVVYGRVNFVGRNPRNLERDLSRIVTSLLSQSLPRMVLPDNGSSVVRLIFLGVAQRFDKIVLVGVDQNDGPYFWTEEPIHERYVEASQLFPRLSGRPHSTSSASDRPHSNETFLPALAKAVAQNSESRVYLASKQSKLFPEIQQHVWQVSSCS